MFDWNNNKRAEDHEKLGRTTKREPRIMKSLRIRVGMNEVKKEETKDPFPSW